MLVWRQIGKTFVFQRSVQDMAHDCGFFYTVQKTRSRSHRLDISIRYTFNAQKSKYKGTGAGQAERQRMYKYATHHIIAVLDAGDKVVTKQDTPKPDLTTTTAVQ